MGHIYDSEEKLKKLDKLLPQLKKDKTISLVIGVKVGDDIQNIKTISIKRFINTFYDESFKASLNDEERLYFDIHLAIHSSFESFLGKKMKEETIVS